MFILCIYFFFWCFAKCVCVFVYSFFVWGTHNCIWVQGKFLCVMESQTCSKCLINCIFFFLSRRNNSIFSAIFFFPSVCWLMPYRFVVIPVQCVCVCVCENVCQKKNENVKYLEQNGSHLLLKSQKCY